MKRRSLAHWQSIVMVVAMLGYVAWAFGWIFRDPVLCLDGHRYFVLIDDAMISMRYGWNLAHGHGLTWNPGERVEGYTSLLMVLVMALASVVADRRVAPLVVQLLAVPTVLLAASCCGLIARQLSAEGGGERPHWAAPLGVIVTLSYFPLGYWTLSGMEVGLATALLAAGVLAAVRGRVTTAGLVLGVGTLARPELAWVGLCVLATVAVARTETTLPAGRLIRAIALLLLFPAAQALWRHGYYGSWVPNTYTLKVTGVPLGMRLANGWSYAWPTLLTLGGVLLVLGIAATRERRFWVPASAVLATIACTIVLGGDAFPLQRFLAPALPLAAAAGIGYCFAISARRPRAGVALGLLIFVSWSSLALAQRGLWSAPRHAGYRLSPQELVNTALVIRQLTTAQARIGVFWAGTIPYYADRRAIDFLGKCDSRIARLPPDLGNAAGGRTIRIQGHNKYDLEYSIGELRPDYVQGFQWGRADLSALGRSAYVRVGFDVPGGSIDVKRGSPNVVWSLVRPQ